MITYTRRDTPDDASGLVKQRKLLSRYHIVGRHGGARIHDVDSNERRIES